MASEPSSLIGYLQEHVQQAASALAGVTRRRVLRSDGWFVRGSLFALVNRDARIVVRLDDPRAQAEAHALPGASGWVIGKKKPMRAWVLLPETFHDDVEAIAIWVRRAWSLAPQKTAGSKKTTAQKEAAAPPKRRHEALGRRRTKARRRAASARSSSTDQ